MGWRSSGSGGVRNRTKVKTFPPSGNTHKVEKSVPPSGYSVRGPRFKLILWSMTFRKIYPSWDAIVKGPQINDAVLSHNDSLFMVTDFIFTSNCMLNYFAPSLDQAGSYLGGFFGTLINKSSQGGYQLCSFFFGVVRILIRKKRKRN